MSGECPSQILKEEGNNVAYFNDFEDDPEVGEKWLSGLKSQGRICLGILSLLVSLMWVVHRWREWNSGEEHRFLWTMVAEERWGSLQGLLHQRVWQSIRRGVTGQESNGQLFKFITYCLHSAMLDKRTQKGEIRIKTRQKQGRFGLLLNCAFLFPFWNISQCFCFCFSFSFALLTRECWKM